MHGECGALIWVLGAGEGWAIYVVIYLTRSKKKKEKNKKEEEDILEI